MRMTSTCPLCAQPVGSGLAAFGPWDAPCHMECAALGGLAGYVEQIDREAAELEAHMEANASENRYLAAQLKDVEHRRAKAAAIGEPR
jgi:hypothetical protein